MTLHHFMNSPGAVGDDPNDMDPNQLPISKQAPKRPRPELFPGHGVLGDINVAVDVASSAEGIPLHSFLKPKVVSHMADMGLPQMTHLSHNSSPLNDCKGEVLFAGTFASTDRQSLTKQAMEAGWKVAPRIRSTTTAVVRGKASRGESSPLKVAALRPEVKIWDEDEWITFMGGVPKGSPAKRRSRGESAELKKPRPKETSPLSNREDAGGILGKAVVFTGNFDQMSRTEHEQKAKSLGCYVRSAVSGKTNYLVHGSSLDEAGERPVTDGTKYKKAKAIVNKETKGYVQILNEQEWMMLVERETGGVTGRVVEIMGASTVADTAKVPVESASLMSARSEADITLSAVWVEKYRPKRVDDLVGNGANIRRLSEWLRDWDDVHISNKKKHVAPPKFGRSTVDNANAKVVLVSGNPGIGKTSAVLAIARDLGYRVLEKNASDQRNEGQVLELTEACGAKTGGITAFLKNRKTGAEERTEKKTVLVFDEVDGLSAGDRGGVSGMLKLVEKSRIPVICLCNDRYAQKLRTLANKALDLKFTKPTSLDGQKLVSRIAEAEGFQVEPNAAQLMMERAGGDFRSVINELQQMFTGATSQGEKLIIRYSDLIGASGSGKNLMMSTSVFEICRTMLTKADHERKFRSMNDRMDMFFMEYDSLPKFMQQNYINSIGRLGGWGPPKPMHNDKRRNNAELKKVARGSRYMLRADALQSKLWKTQNWGLLPDIGYLSSIAPSYVCADSLQRADFPVIMGQGSTRRVSRRYTVELSDMLAHRGIVVSSSALRGTPALDLLYEKLMYPMRLLHLSAEQGGTSVEDVLRKWERLGVTPDILKDKIIKLRLKSQTDEYAKIDTKSKTAITRCFNTSKKEFVDEDTDFATMRKAANAAKAKAKAKAKAVKRAKKGII